MDRAGIVILGMTFSPSLVLFAFFTVLVMLVVGYVFLIMLVRLTVTGGSFLRSDWLWWTKSWGNGALSVTGSIALWSFTVLAVYSVVGLFHSLPAGLQAPVVTLVITLVVVPAARWVAVRNSQSQSVMIRIDPVKHNDDVHLHAFLVPKGAGRDMYNVRACVYENAPETLDTVLPQDIADLLTRGIAIMDPTSEKGPFDLGNATMYATAQPPIVLTVSWETTSPLLRGPTALEAIRYRSNCIIDLNDAFLRAKAIQGSGDDGGAPTAVQRQPRARSRLLSILRLVP